jgi:hypothetical protein
MKILSVVVAAIITSAAVSVVPAQAQLLRGSGAAGGMLGGAGSVTGALGQGRTGGLGGTGGLMGSGSASVSHSVSGSVNAVHGPGRLGSPSPNASLGGASGLAGSVTGGANGATVGGAANGSASFSRATSLDAGRGGVGASTQSAAQGQTSVQGPTED